MPLGFLLGIGIAASRGSYAATVTVVAIAVVAMVLVIAASGVVRQTFAVVLYR